MMIIQGDPISPDGWGEGGVETDQALLAAQFYRQIAEEKASKSGVEVLYSAPIVLAGHSLGGGLSGLLATLYNKPAWIYDNMPFEKYAQQVWDTASIDEEELLDLLESVKSDEEAQIIEEHLERVREVRNNYFSGSPPLKGLNKKSIKAFYTEGEILGLTRIFQTVPTKGFDSHSTELGPIDLHTMSLLVLLMFSDGKYRQWHSIGTELWNAAFDDSVALAAGYLPPGDNNENGHYSPSSKLLAATAYSALDEGTLVFGDTGIRALFDDADQLGAYTPERAAYTQALAEILVQFAGQLALKEIARSDYASAVDGVIEVKDGVLAVSVDKEAAAWSLDKAGQRVPEEIVGYTTLASIIKDELSQAHSEDSKHLQQVLELLDDGIDAVLLAVMNGEELDAEAALSLLARGDYARLKDRAKPSVLVLGTAAKDRIVSGGSSDVAYGDDGDDILKTGEGEDWLLGGYGEDELHGGAGDDTLLGGPDDDKLYGEAGDDILDGGEGNDLIDGGERDDTVSYEDAKSGVKVYLDTGQLGGGAEGDVLRSIENIIGSRYDDELRGDRADNTIEGLDGNDLIEGGKGDDILKSGEGDVCSAAFGCTWFAFMLSLC